jgi:hypothetical protein
MTPSQRAHWLRLSDYVLQFDFCVLWHSGSDECVVMELQMAG